VILRIPSCAVNEPHVVFGRETRALRVAASTSGEGEVPASTRTFEPEVRLPVVNAIA
jgi:hypothetical protein